MKDLKCERCGGSGLVEGKVAWIDCSCQPQQERSEEIYGIMFKDKDGQFVMSNSETAHDFLKRKADEARADERKKTFESVIALVESEGKCYCGLAETIHTDGCAENRAVIKRLSNAIDRLSKDL